MLGCQRIGSPNRAIARSITFTAPYDFIGGSMNKQDAGRLQFADDGERNLNRLFADINQTVSVKDNRKRLSGEHLGKGIDEEALVIQHCPATQIFRGDRLAHPSGQCIAHRLAGLYMGDFDAAA
jgi:hypothetical protein